MRLWILLALLVAPFTPSPPRTLLLFDAVRDRPVPIAVYEPAALEGRLPGLVILSHGYGGVNTDYSFIANALSRRGYLVASIQHGIPGDKPLPAVGDPALVRRPSWQQGVENILFVIGELKRTRPEVDFGNLVLIGHSHGGDTSMLFAREHPDLVRIVISLDNRRMPFPRTARPRVFSIRSSDQAADDGVIPKLEEQAALGMEVVKLQATIHNDMWDGGTEAQKAEMLRLILSFITRAS
jgi:predicted dienelactone hydrolase